MNERPLPIPPEAGGADSNQPDRPDATPFDDPRALTILNTEHWSLMSARGLVYNEAFARAGMFLSFLSATLVALGLIATATQFSDGFLTVAAAVLSLNLFVGLASLGRIAAASGEDIRYLQGMNRLRHAYHEMVPGLERYFVSSAHDDMTSVLSFYGPSVASPMRSLLHGVTTTPGMVSVICSAVTGALGAILALLLTNHDALIAASVGGGGFLLAFATLNAFMIWHIRRGMRGIRAMFPRTDWSDDDDD
jgi:hypothetical protein